MVTILEQNLRSDTKYTFVFVHFVKDTWVHDKGDHTDEKEKAKILQRKLTRMRI